MSAVITGKNYLVTKMNRYNKYQTKQCKHTLTHRTHYIWWLVLGWVTTKEDHLCLRIAYTSYIWRVIKFYLLTYVVDLAVFFNLGHFKKSFYITLQDVRTFFNLLITRAAVKSALMHQ